MKHQEDNPRGLDLVKGMFTAEEAREVLMSLISSKLRFHSKKNQHAYEKTGQTDPKSEERILELKQLRKQIVAELREAEQKGLMVDVNANIQLSFMETVNS